VTEALLSRCRATLLRERARRPRPHRDDKILTAWNGLMISALARGYGALGEPRYLEAARAAALFLKGTLWQNGQLLRTYRLGAGAIPGFAEDYAFLVQGLLDLFEADFNQDWLRWALDLQMAQDELFWDSVGGGYFSSPAEDSSILVRLKDDNDGAEPSSNSVSVRNLLRLSELTGRDEFHRKAEQTVNAFGGILQKMPSALPQMLHSMGGLLHPWRQIVIAGDLGSADTQALLKAVRGRYLSETVVLHAGSLLGAETLSPQLALAAQMQPVAGKAAAYVCQGFACRAPVTEASELKALLDLRE